MVLLVMAGVTTACATASPGTSQGAGASEGTQASAGASASQGGGGGGGGGGANGSITYTMTGAYTASGELPFQGDLISTWIDANGGWVATFAQAEGGTAYIQLNTQTTGSGQIFIYGAVGNLVSAASDPSTGGGCTFTLTKNDASGLKGSLDCPTAEWVDSTSGTTGTVVLHAEWDAHP
jgi:hypothetical protein